MSNFTCAKLNANDCQVHILSLFFLDFFNTQIQCSDCSCKVQEFLAQALDPPSPIAGKKRVKDSSITKLQFHEK